VKEVSAFGPELIAPCGMDCGVCIAHLRTRNRCAGCGVEDPHKARHCAVCAIKNCEKLPQGVAYCFECSAFPCARLRSLDKRYRTNYGMSMLENLESIRTHGVEAFVAAERVRWRCAHCGELRSVHRRECPNCGGPAETTA